MVSATTATVLPGRIGYVSPGRCIKLKRWRRRIRRIFSTSPIRAFISPSFYLFIYFFLYIEKNRRNRRNPALSTPQSLKLSAGKPSVYPSERAEARRQPHRSHRWSRPSSSRRRIVETDSPTERQPSSRAIRSRFHSKPGDPDSAQGPAFPAHSCSSGRAGSCLQASRPAFASS